MRFAVVADIPAAAKLCYGFAAEAEPFLLTMEDATKEATLFVHRKQLWVHTIKAVSKTLEVNSIVAVTRESGSVAAITKVYTNPDWRSRKWPSARFGKSRKDSKPVAEGSSPPAKIYSHTLFSDLFPKLAT